MRRNERTRVSLGARLPVLASVLLTCCAASSGRNSAGSAIPETPRADGVGGEPSAVPLASQTTPSPICGIDTDEAAEAVADGWMRASSRGPGCVECPDPVAFLSGLGGEEDALEKRVSRAAHAMEKTRRRLDIDPASDDDAPPAGPPDPDALHQHISREMEELRRMGDDEWSGLYLAVCLTSPAFRDAFAPFTEQLLSSAKPGKTAPGADGRDPDLTGGTAFLAMQIVDERSLGSLVRFIRSGQDSDARENVVQHICAFAMTDEVHKAIQWVIDNDPAFKSKAIKCLRKYATAPVDD